MNGDQVLLIKDDKEIRKGVEIFLKGQGYAIFQAADGAEGLKVLEGREIDLAIVDVIMPRIDGITITARLRERYSFSVIFLSTRLEGVDKILGLNMRADGYITKSFTPIELMVRVNSQLWRYHRFLDCLNSKQTENPKVYRLGGLGVNEETVEVIADDRAAKVTPIEFKVLFLLIQSPGHASPVEETYERMWNERATSTGMVMAHIRSLRERIEVSPREPKCVRAVWGAGYKIEKQP